MSLARQARLGRALQLLARKRSIPTLAPPSRPASNRNHPVRGGSNETSITEEVRDLIRNVRHAENIDDWQRSPLVENPIVVKPYSPNGDQDLDDDQGFHIEYWPHRGELDRGMWAKKARGEFEPPLVLLAEKLDASCGCIGGVRWWHLEAMEKLGLGENVWDGKIVAVPNMTFYTALLFQVKHLVKITPVSFPNGVPAEDGFDENAATLTNDGRFVYHPKIGERAKALRLGEERGEAMAIRDKTVNTKCVNTWKLSPDSPLGNSNYSRNTMIASPEADDRTTDSVYKVKY